MTRTIRKYQLRWVFFISKLVLVWIFPSDFWQQPAFGEKGKNIMLAPQGQGSAWDLPAGSYDDSDPNDSDTYQGGSPIPGGGGSNASQGGSPTPGSGYGDIDCGGSPRPAGGSTGSNQRGSPRPAD